jgi:hypothetical protein
MRREAVMTFDQALVDFKDAVAAGPVDPQTAVRD